VVIKKLNVKKGLLFMLIALFSCNVTPQEKAEINVKAYMLEFSLHPKTYEGIDFEKIEKDSVSEYPYHISHLYRSKSKAGEMVVSHRVFFLDSAYAVKKDITLKEYNELIRK
jgi:hypothetical protein